MNPKTLQRQSWKTVREIGVPMDQHPGWVDVSGHAVSHPDRPDNLIGMYCTRELSVQKFEHRFFNGSDRHEDHIQPMVVLGVRRHDTQPVKFWDTLQEVKNVLAGPEATAVEIYPPESEVVNDANMRWLWVIPECEILGFGWARGGGGL